jgi:Na+/melibiose symporter-like transporter
MIDQQEPLSPAKIGLYSVGDLGASIVYSFANTAFPLFLTSYPAVPNWAVGLLAQERSLVGAFIQPLVGAISDRLPPNRLGKRRPFFLLGVPLAAVALLFFASHPPMVAVLAVMTIFSFFLNIAYDPYLALMIDIAPEKQRGRIGGVMAVFRMCGQAVTITIAFLLWTNHEPLVFLLVALGLVVAFSVTFVSVQEPDIVPQVKPEGLQLKPAEYLRDLWSQREVMKYLGATFFYWFGVGGVIPFITRFGVQALDLKENVSFTLLLPALVGTALAAVPAGIIGERVGKKPVLAAGLAIFGVATVLSALLARSYVEALIALFLLGLCNGVANALLFPLFTELIPGQRAGELTGISSTVWSLAQPIGAFGAGLLADGTGTVRGAFAAAGVALLIGFGLLMTVRVPRTARVVHTAPDPEIAMASSRP